jgi:hypothetical protein
MQKVSPCTIRSKRRRRRRSSSETVGPRGSSPWKANRAERAASSKLAGVELANWGNCHVAMIDRYYVFHGLWSDPIRQPPAVRRRSGNMSNCRCRYREWLTDKASARFLHNSLHRLTLGFRCAASFRYPRFAANTKNGLSRRNLLRGAAVQYLQIRAVRRRPARERRRRAIELYDENSGLPLRGH